MRFIVALVSVSSLTGRVTTNYAPGTSCLIRYSPIILSFRAAQLELLKGCKIGHESEIKKRPETYLQQKHKTCCEWEDCQGWVWSDV